MMNAKGESSAPIWQKGLLILCMSSMIMFSLFLAMDMESAMKITGLASLRLRTQGGSSPYSPRIPEDDPTCLSRTQHLLFRRSSGRLLPPPSPALLEAWKNYHHLHRSCSQGKNWTSHFLDSHRQADPCRYLIFIEGGAGLGNKILSLVSALTYAIATDRVLLLDSRHLLPHLLCDPFPHSSWILPPAFPYDQIESSPSLDQILQAKSLHPQVLNLHLEHIQRSGDQQFFCNDRQSELMTVRWIGWTSTQYYVPSMLAMASLWERLEPLFPGRKDFFPQLARLIIVPANALWARIVRVYWGYLSCGGSRVGIQIRLHGRRDLAAFDSAALDRITDCLTSRNVLPKLARDDDDDDDDQSNVSRRWERLTSRIYRKEEEKSADVSVLIASLQQRYFEEMKDLYTRRSTEDGRIVRVHMVSHGGREEKSMVQAEDALVEMYLLSFSDHLATSAYSTFGYIAQGIGGIHPYILNIRGDNITNNGLPSCYVGQSIEPCTHYPQRPVCEGSKPSIEHQAWLDKHTQPCQDQEGGLQLVYSRPTGDGC